MHGPPFSVSPVFSLLKEVLTAMVVCMLEEHAGPFLGFAGMDLSAEETFLNGRDAFWNFPCLAIKIGPLKELQLEMSSNLEEMQMMFLCIHLTTNTDPLRAIQSDHVWYHWTYMPEQTTRSDTIVEANPMVIIWILPWDKDILIAHVVWPLIQDPKAPLYFCRITAAKKGMKVTCVSFTLIGSSLEVSVFVERNLSDKTQHWQFTMC